jgi:60 kDa SS-A/Ro ribonucleoprotein
MPDVFTTHVTPNATPQTEQARADQVLNNTGGYVFKAADKTRLNRFLTIGTEGGTYYQKEKALTRQNAALVTAMAQESNPALIGEAVAISVAGRAPRNNPALFAIAAAAGLGNDGYRQRALNMLPLVARTGSHLLRFMDYAPMFRGWGPQLTKGIGAWYLQFSATAEDVAVWEASGRQRGEPRPKTIDDLAYQLLKYKQRDGWSHRDVMRLAHFGRQAALAERMPRHKALFDYVMKGDFNAGLLPPIVDVAEQAHETRDVKDWVRLIASNRSLSHEMLPSEALAAAGVWEAMIEHGNLPLGALLRNLGRLTKLGVIAPFAPATETVIKMLTDPQRVTGARIHPIAVLIAMKTYGQGHGTKGKLTWNVVPQIMDALNSMFYLAFGSVRPSGKRTIVAIDVSGSMAERNFSNGHMSLYESTGCTPREIAAAMAMIVARTEPQWFMGGFSSQFVPLDISATQRLDDVVRSMSRVRASYTDMSLPMRWAAANSVQADTFQIWTDNEVNQSTMHPFEALKEYRRWSGLPSRMQVAAVTPTEFSIADPTDPGMLDVSGFDAAVPNLLADHARGDL